MRLGGSERHVLQLAAGLRQRGHHAGIACLFQEGLLAPEIRKEGIPFACLNASGSWGVQTLGRILDWIRANPMDILHTYLFGFHFFAGFPARWAKVPVILSSRREIANWQKRRHAWLENLGNLFVDRVVSCSKAVETRVLTKEKISPQKVTTIYNGIDLGKFHSLGQSVRIRESFQIPRDAPLVGTVANMAIEKGYPYLLEASERVLRANPRVWFLFVGFGPLEKEMKEKARKIPKGGQIVFAGARRDIPDLMEVMDLFVLASVIEGFPNVLLEAAAMAKPVIATQVGGIPELIESGRNGLLVPPRNGTALSDAILSLLGDRARAAHLGRLAQEKIKRDFQLERMVNQYEELYLSLLKEKGLSAPPGPLVSRPSEEAALPLSS